MKKTFVRRFQTRKSAIDFAKQVGSKAVRTGDDFFKYEVSYVVDSDEKK